MVGVSRVVDDDAHSATASAHNLVHRGTRHPCGLEAGMVEHGGIPHGIDWQHRPPGTQSITAHDDDRRGEEPDDETEEQPTGEDHPTEHRAECDAIRERKHADGTDDADQNRPTRQESFAVGDSAAHHRQRSAAGLGFGGMTTADVQVLITRLDEELPLPSYAHPGDAGLDLVARTDCTLQPGERVLVPTGIAIALPAGYVATVHARSGLALRSGLAFVNAPGVIDAGYRGEIGVIAVNLDQSTPIQIARGDRIAQLVITRFAVAGLVEVSELPGSMRATGGFGSTGGFGAAAPNPVADMVGTVEA